MLYRPSFKTYSHHTLCMPHYHRFQHLHVETAVQHCCRRLVLSVDSSSAYLKKIKARIFVGLKNKSGMLQYCMHKTCDVVCVAGSRNCCCLVHRRIFSTARQYMADSDALRRLRRRTQILQISTYLTASHASCKKGLKSVAVEECDAHRSFVFESSVSSSVAANPCPLSLSPLNTPGGVDASRGIKTPPPWL